MRVRGGTSGLLSAIDSGAIDPENAALPEDIYERPNLRGSDLRRVICRDSKRKKDYAKRAKKRLVEK